MPASFDDATVQAIKDAADIIEIIGENVQLRRTGINYKGLCPFHNEKTPSFTVHPDRKTYHCFGCGEGGDVFSFLMNYHSLSFKDALRQLATRYHIPLPEGDVSPQERQQAKRKKHLQEINAQAAAIYHRFLLKDNRATGARQYLKKRGVPQEVINAFQLGYAPDSWEFIVKELSQYPPEDLFEAGLIVANKRGGYYDRFRDRVLFPIMNHSGRHVGFGGRTLGDSPAKYINSPESAVFNKSQILFGLFQNKPQIRSTRSCILVEGNFDLIALSSCGIHTAVAPLGTALTAHHVKSIKGYVEEAIILFDGDAPGLKAAMRSVPIFLSQKVPARVAVLPDGHDPDTYLQAHGKDQFQALLTSALPLSDFVFNQLVKQYGMGLEGKIQIAAELKPIIQATADNENQRKLFIAHFSEKLGLSAEAFLDDSLTSQSDKPGQRLPSKVPPASEQPLSKKEEQLLTFLFIYPEHLEDFLQAGFMDIMSNTTAQNVLDAIKSHQKTDGQPNMDQLLPQLPDAERSFVSRFITSAPNVSDEFKEEELQEKISWIRRTALKNKLTKLTEEINAAAQANDHDRIMKLMIEKNHLNELLTS